MKNIQMGMEEVVKDILRAEIAMPEEVIMKLKFTKIFWRAGETNKITSSCLWSSTSRACRACVQVCQLDAKPVQHPHLHPEALIERASELERAAYRMRHPDPSYNTSIK